MIHAGDGGEPDCHRSRIAGVIGTRYVLQGAPAVLKVGRGGEANGREVKEERGLRDRKGRIVLRILPGQQLIDRFVMNTTVDM